MAEEPAGDWFFQDELFDGDENLPENWLVFHIRYGHPEDIEFYNECWIMGDRKAHWLFRSSAGKKQYTIDATGTGAIWNWDPDIDYPRQKEFGEIIFHEPRLPNDLRLHQRIAVMRWINATIRMVGNPVVLHYSNEGEEKIWVDNIEKGSISQAKQVISLINNFHPTLQFHQQQNGGRPSGLTDDTKKFYDKILRLYCLENRPPNKIFLKKHTEFKQWELSAAKKWENNGGWKEYRTQLASYYKQEK